MLDSIVREVTDSYLETALWAETNSDEYPDDNCPPPLDDKYCVADFTEESRRQAEADCVEFLGLLDSVTVDEGYSLLDCAYDLQGYGRIGHDFWLTRNGHGAGFWDGDYEDRSSEVDYGDRITEIVHDNFAECNVWADGEGGVYLD